MNKKAQGLPITTIIVAILGLVVLVILFAILTGRLTIFAGAANECPGVCLVDSKKLTELGLEQKPGILETKNSPGRDGLECNPATEKRLYGSFIASGIRAGEEETPIACQKCCQRLA